MGENGRILSMGFEDITGGKEAKGPTAYEQGWLQVLVNGVCLANK